MDWTVWLMSLTCTRSRPPWDRAPCTPAWTPQLRTSWSEREGISNGQERGRAYLSVQLVVHHSLEAPGSVTAGSRGQAVLLDVDGEHRVLGLGQLALVVVRAGGEQDAQAGLKVDGLAGWVLPAGLNAVVEDESSGLTVQHVGRGRVDKSWEARRVIIYRILYKSYYKLYISYHIYYSICSSRLTCDHFKGDEVRGAVLLLGGDGEQAGGGQAEAEQGAPHGGGQVWQWEDIRSSKKDSCFGKQAAENYLEKQLLWEGYWMKEKSQQVLQLSDRAQPGRCWGFCFIKLHCGKVTYWPITCHTSHVTREQWTQIVISTK